ncbi:MAG: 2-dehydropantoate 2-reductase [Halioglobus sp.]
MKTSWHILGAGSIGCLFAAKLDKAGCKTTLIFKKLVDYRASRPTSFSFQLHTPTETLKLTMPASYAEDIDPIGHLLITTKAYDAIDAVASIAHRLDTNSHVVLLVNGMGLLEQLEEKFPQLSFYVGTTTEGAYRRSRRDIVHAGTGITKLGRRDTTRPPPWFSAFKSLEVSCRWESEIDRALWQKLAINCAVNPLTAVHRCLNGELKTRADLAEKLGHLCDEIAAIATAAGQSELAVRLHQQVSKVVSDTAANRSSMLQDIDAKRRTEIDYISGYLIQTAAELNIRATLNEELLAEIRKLELSMPIGKDLG